MTRIEATAVEIAAKRCKVPMAIQETGAERVACVINGIPYTNSALALNKITTMYLKAYKKK